MSSGSELADRGSDGLAGFARISREAVIVQNLDGIVVSWNKTAERTFGYPAKEALGRPLELLIPDEDRESFSLLAERLFAGETLENLERRCRQKTGKLVEVSLSMTPIRDAQGVMKGGLCLALDLADRKRLARAERDQLFLASIVSSADDAIISKDLDGIVTSWNRAAERMFGYTAEEMIGQPIQKLIPPEHIDEEPQILERIRRGEKIEHYESERRRKDGRNICVSLTISPVKDRLGRVIGASKIARDTTERQRWKGAELAQSFLGALVESAEDAIISKNLEGIVTTWNPGAERLYGYTAAEMIGKPISQLIPADHPDEEPKILEQVRRGQRVAHYETKRVRKDGSIIDVSLTVSPIRDSLGRILGASKIARDISETKRMLRQAEEARLQADVARRQAEEANRTKDEFLATVSHELRTPITSILGWSRMLMSRQLDPERQQRAFETIDRNARSQAQLIDDLLDVSRIISGKLRVEFTLVDLPAVIGSAIEVVRLAAEAKRIRIDSHLNSSVGPILGDAERLQQVIWNLLSNAIKFTPHDGHVQIELQRVASQVELRVTDSGVGIEPAFLPHVFERFSQADASITRNSGGLGMGLAIVKSLVELHGGRITVSSEGLGKGAAFTIRLPVSAVRYMSQPYRAPDKPVLKSEVTDRPGLVGLKILVVDDEPDTRELLRYIFNASGSIVETADGVESALDLLDEQQPDFLVSDIGMPGRDGYELIRIIRERGSKMPAVALTAMARTEDRLKALTAGYQMHVVKPIEPVELLTIVASLVGLVERRPGP
jgi:PAS domain S-box-containing protein